MCACSLVHAFRPRCALQLSGASEMPLGADFDFVGVLLAAGPLAEHSECPDTSPPCELVADECCVACFTCLQ